MPRISPSEEVRLMLTRADLMHEFACALKDLRAWRGSVRDAHARTLAMFGGYGTTRGLWLDDAVVACRIVGEDPVSDYFVKAAEEGEKRRIKLRLAELEDPDRPRIASVRPRTARRKAG